MDIVLPILQNSAASYVINKLMGAATTYLRDQYYWKADLQEELQNLRGILPKIQAVVSFAEQKLTSYEASNPALMEWLQQFRDGIDEAEEVLDELEYRELEKKSDSDKSRLSRAVDASGSAAKRLRESDDVLERLRTCVKNLNTSASDVGNFLTLVTQTGGISSEQIQQEITSPLPALSFKGREEEKGKIIQYFLGDLEGESEIQRSENVHCLPLVAMGGMGKTALAQQVFDHFENVKKEHFDRKIWVCVSTDFNASSIMKTILEYSTRRSESGPLELIPVKLKEELHSKRFLLVLDDAWDDKKQTEWEKLCAPLLYGQKGSWILLTTRLGSVVKMVSKAVRGTMEPMNLPGLSKDECRSLLYEHAFAGQNPNEFPLLKKIGEEIVEKLHGVPLLAKSIGGGLNSKLEPYHWANISKSEVWKTPQDLRDEFIPALTLSYAMLPPRLKRCFSYCGIFPQDYQFDKQKLVGMWVAAGLIYSDGLEEGSDEDIANRCFDMLCNKSFFDVHTYNRTPICKISFYKTEGLDFYTMHDMLSGLARYVSRYECCRIVDVPPSSILDYNAIRHISISITGTDDPLHDLAKMVCKLKHLRTLWIQFGNMDPQKLNDFIRDACKSPRRIRVLIMKAYYSREISQCLESISDFVKLRFLDIAGVWFFDNLQPLSLSLSKSICKFHFLQVLIGSRGYSILAKDANKLTNLRHLYGVHEDGLLSVAEVGKLTSLQELCFSVGTEPGYRIDELMNMNDLRRLKIKGLFNVRSLEEANKVNLVRKSNLTSLELHYGVALPFNVRSLEANSDPDLDQQEVLTALRPPPTIKELLIRNYKGSRPAPWMDTSSLSWLESLELHDCTSLEELPPLWKLPCLKFLQLRWMEAIKSLGCHSSDQMDKQFPILEELVFDSFPLWEKWNGADDYVWFPHLKSFKIKFCPRLKKIPDLPLSIVNLKMEYLGLEELPPLWKLPCLKLLTLNKMKTIKSLDCHSSDQMNIQFPVLEELVFNNFPLWVEWNGADDYIWFPHLKSFVIENCPKLKKIPDLPLSIEKLRMVDLGLEAFPRSYKCSNGSRTFEGFQQLTTVESLEIDDYLIIGEENDNLLPSSLKNLGLQGFLGRQKFLSVEELLEDKRSKHAVSSSSVFYHSARNKAASILPSSLEYLSISDSDISQELLGRCLQDLTSLEELEVSRCRHLVSLPNIEYLHNLTALRTLDISDCEELRNLESLTALVTLRSLFITGCPKLLATIFSTPQNPTTTTEESATKIKKGTLPSLEKIVIGSIFYLPNLPMSPRLKILSIKEELISFIVPVAEFTCFPSEIEESLLQYQESLEVLELARMPHLQSLPASLENFSSLETFRIYSSSELKSLPRMPASLKELTIYGCSATLKKRCQENIGPDWPNISHIPRIYITAGIEDVAERRWGRMI